MFILDMNQLFFTIEIYTKLLPEDSKEIATTSDFTLNVIIRNVSKFVHQKIKSLSLKELKRKCYKSETLNLEYRLNILENLSHRMVDRNVILPEKEISKDGLTISEFITMIESDIAKIIEHSHLSAYRGEFISIKQKDENSFLIIINFK